VLSQTGYTKTTELFLQRNTGLNWGFLEMTGVGGGHLAGLGIGAAVVAGLLQVNMLGMAVCGPVRRWGGGEGAGKVGFRGDPHAKARPGVVMVGRLGDARGPRGGGVVGGGLLVLRSSGFPLGWELGECTLSICVLCACCVVV